MAIANPVIKSLKKDEWRLVASNVTKCDLWLIDEGQNALYTYRITGGTAPTDKNEGVRFIKPYMFIRFDYAIDIYVMALENNGHLSVHANSSTHSATIGEIRESDIKITLDGEQPAVKFVDETGTTYGIKHISNKPRVSSVPYTYDIAEGNVSGHSRFTKIGYTPSLTANVNTDIWSYAPTQPVYIFPDVAMQMEYLSSNNTDDIGTQIKTGTSTGGSLTSLIDAGANFTGATAVQVGDCILLDKAGTTPEFGWVTAVVSATELTVSGGFSQGGTGALRGYIIIDTSATAGAHAVQINYLDGSYAQKKEIMILNGTTVTTTVNTNIFRINSFRVISAGANKIPTGNLTIRHINNTPVYSYITAGFNRARNAMYTVPAGKNLYVTDIAAGFATTGNANKEFARITTRANIDPDTNFQTDGLFYPFTDIVTQNNTNNIQLNMPTKLPAKTDIKFSAIATVTGTIITTLRGWLEDA